MCKFCADKVDLVDYKDVRRLRNFVSDRGKIIPRRISGSCARHQRQLTHAIKVERRRVALDEPIKSLGETVVSIRLHHDVAAQLKVSVVRE